ncbi:hypothetical protein A3N60_01730 [Klebsiella aerogenes]|nr:hypothetical protein A3N60_01730 [Klebsiella aerogenes]
MPGSRNCSANCAGVISSACGAGGTLAWIDAGLALEQGETHLATPRGDRYRRPYEGTDNSAEAMQAYLDWEYGLVEQLARDGTHGFKVL